MSITICHEEEQKTTTQTASVPLASSSRPRAQAPSAVGRRFLTVLPPTLLGLALLLVWSMSVSHGLVPSYELPAPTDVWQSLWDGITSGLFLSNAWITIQESLGGFFLAVLIALPVGYGLARGRLFALTLSPYLAAGQAIPAIVIAPFLIIWLGYGMLALVVLCALIVLFPMLITTALGFQVIDESLVEAARVEGASFWPMLTRIEIPLALPAIMAAVRTGLTLSIVGALVGEFVNNSDRGLGALVQIAKSQYNMPLMFATVVVLALMAALFYGLARLLTRLSEGISH